MNAVFGVVSSSRSTQLHPAPVVFREPACLCFGSGRRLLLSKEGCAPDGEGLPWGRDVGRQGRGVGFWGGWCYCTSPRLQLVDPITNNLKYFQTPLRNKVC